MTNDDSRINGQSFAYVYGPRSVEVLQIGAS
jgi:hypothetical protein